MTVLSPFGIYNDGHEQIVEPTRTELVEQDRLQTEVIPDFQLEIIELPKRSFDLSRIVAIHSQQIRLVHKKASARHSNAPTFYKKTTQSTSSEDEPLSTFPFA